MTNNNNTATDYLKKAVEGFEKTINKTITDTATAINEAAAKRQRVDQYLDSDLLLTNTSTTTNPYMTFKNFTGDWSIGLGTNHDEILLKAIEEENKRKHDEDLKKQNEEEWIWIHGYKGTRSDMVCRDYQFELGKKFDMPEDELIVECSNGFHLCKELKHVFNYYSLGSGNRYFEVSALVRKKDVDYYNTTTNVNSWLIGRKDKLVAKSILFTRELTADEILSGAGIDAQGWTEEDKTLAIEKHPEEVTKKYRKNELIEMGYSPAFSEFIVDAGISYYDAAKKIGTQEDLSMDMKVLAILRLS